MNSINTIVKYLKSIETHLINYYFRKFGFSEAFCLPVYNVGLERTKTDSKTITDFLNDSFLWAVPKSRRTIEKRLKRKYGHPDYHWKMIEPKTNIISCITCGNSHEAGHLCPKCYKRIIQETEEMQKQIEKELKLDPIDKEVVVLYDGDIKGSNEFWQGKKIVDMQKPRPAWFSKNLLQKTTNDANTTNETLTSSVKPKNLA